jgi:hypothetical protein
MVAYGQIHIYIYKIFNVENPPPSTTHDHPYQILTKQNRFSWPLALINQLDESFRGQYRGHHSIFLTFKTISLDGPCDENNHIQF